MTELAGRTALVTGGASGIGEACARELAARGAVVTVADRDDVGAKSVAGDISGKAWPVDLSDVSALEELQLEADILVNNAGVQHVGPIPEFSPDRFRHMMTLMVESPFLLIRAALPHMYRQNFGRIINISSVHGIRESAIKRLVEPEEVAALVGWLASPTAGMVTGASYTMDGGWSAR
jgi:3-hydroxybutyrate dehydrogenase